MDLLRFNKIAEVEYSSNTIDDMTIEEYVESKGLGRDLLDLYLVPMASSLWSSTPNDMRNFSAKALLQFFHNHRLNSGLKGHLKWLTIAGGAKEYIKRVIPPFDNCIQLNKEVISIEKSTEAVEVKTKDGQSYKFDIVIVAAHGDQALSILSNPSELEKNLLSQFKYTANSVLLHSDSSIMPKNKRCWASWNHLIEKDEHGLSHASTHYWMNNLQSLETKNNYFVSLNADSLINPNSVIKRLHYTHPTFSIKSIKTQRSLSSINNQEKDQRLFFCGSYFGYGFHEDALSSALDLCQLISV
jgi:predicted NAD/FAD-binding protein